MGVPVGLASAGLAAPYKGIDGRAGEASQMGGIPHSKLDEPKGPHYHTLRRSAGKGDSAWSLRNPQTKAEMHKPGALSVHAESPMGNMPEARVQGASRQSPTGENASQSASDMHQTIVPPEPKD